MQYDFNWNTLRGWLKNEIGFLNVSHYEEINVDDSFILPFHDPETMVVIMLSRLE